MSRFLLLLYCVHFKKSTDLREVVTKIDICNIVLETDCPYLTPEPFRGKKNSPIYIETKFNLSF